MSLSTNFLTYSTQKIVSVNYAITYFAKISHIVGLINWAPREQNAV